MTKTKIVIATQRMMMGGIEKALISMLEQIPKDIFDVTLLVAHPGGELFDRIPNHVKVKTIFENDSRITKTMFDYMIKGRLIKSLIILINAFLLRLGTKSEFEAGVFYSRASRMEERDYDVAISFSGSFSLPVVYVPKNINANKKILWIHSDLGKIDSKEHRLLIKKLNKYYRLFDNILCVSNHTLKQFNKVFPKLKNEKIVFYNILNKDKIKKLSMEGESFHDSFMGVRILTVGRLGEEKGQDIIPSILLRLLADGYNVRWYCIGGDYGFQKQLKRIVNDNRLGNNLILMGTKQNPLPFIKDCDLYIQPSRYESYCLTVAEARSLNKPIITTNTGASEQIEHEKTGLVVEFDELQIYESIKRLLNDEPLKERLINNLAKESINTTSEMEKLYRIIGKTS